MPWAFTNILNCPIDFTSTHKTFAKSITFSRRFYPKRLTVHSGYTFFCQYVCSLGIEPTTFALLTQCYTTGTQYSIVQYSPPTSYYSITKTLERENKVSQGTAKVVQENANVLWANSEFLGGTQKFYKILQKHLNTILPSI